MCGLAAVAIIRAGAGQETYGVRGPCESGISPATDGNIPTQAPKLAAAKEEGKGLSSCVHFVMLKLKD